MGFFSGAGQILLGAAVVGAAVPSCYSAGAGTAPPPNTFYFPVGLAVSDDGSVLYAVNSDFDLQWNGGTLQSYDLTALRAAATQLIASPPEGCPGTPPPGGTLLGQRCAPPTASQPYIRDWATIGAFATELQISIAVAPSTPPAAGAALAQPTLKRLFIPVRGDATVTWADIDPSHPSTIDCGQGQHRRCDANHQAGSNPNQLHNTRQVTMPGEPFGMAQTEDGAYLAVTSQTTTQTSLLTTGFGPAAPLAEPPPNDPTMEFVLGGMPNGGIGIAAVPHDPDPPAPGMVGPASATSTQCADPIDQPPCLPSSRCEDPR